MDARNAALYAENSRLQFVWNQKYLSEIEWGASSRVVDVGCGTGETTQQLIATRDEVKCVLAFDISIDMIQHAKEHNSHDKISYVTGNVDDMSLLDKLQHQTDVCKRGSFDRVVSLNVLHWVKDQSVAIRNIISLLHPGGDCLLVLASRPPAAFLHAKNGILELEVWKGMTHDDVKWRHGKDPEWAQYNTWRQPDPAVGYRRLCEQEGLVVSRSEVHEVRYTFGTVEECKGVLQYLLPHTQQIPEDLLPRFMDDVYELFQSVCPKDAGGHCVWDADFLVVNAKLP